MRRRVKLIKVELQVECTRFDICVLIESVVLNWALVVVKEKHFAKTYKTIGCICARQLQSFMNPFKCMKKNLQFDVIYVIRNFGNHFNISMNFTT